MGRNHQSSRVLREDLFAGADQEHCYYVEEYVFEAFIKLQVRENTISIYAFVYPVYQFIEVPLRGCFTLSCTVKSGQNRLG